MFKRLLSYLHKLLLWSEKYTKTDMVYLASGGFWVSLGQLTVAVTVFITAIVFANYLPAEVYGTYKYVIATMSVLGSFTLTGLGTSMSKSVSRGYDGTFVFGFKKSVQWSLGVTGVCVGLSLYYFYNQNINLSASFAIAGLLFPILTGSSLYTAFLSGKKKFKEFTQYWIAANILSTLVVLLTVTQTQNIPVLILAYFGSNALFNFIMHLRTLKVAGKSKLIDDDFLNYAKHLSVQNVLNGVASNIDKIIIFHYLGAIELAVYSFALAIPDQLRAILLNVNRLAFPKFSKQTVQTLQKHMHKKMLPVFVVSSVMVILYVIFAEQIFAFLFPRYIEAVAYSRILALSLLVTAGTLPLTALQSQGAKRELYIFTTINNVFQIIITFILIQLGGLIGAVFAILLKRLLANILPSIIFYSMKQENKQVDS